MKKLKMYLREQLKNLVSKLPVGRKRHEDEVFKLMLRLGTHQTILRGLLRNVLEELAKAEVRKIGNCRAIENITSHAVTAMKLLSDENADK